MPKIVLLGTTASGKSTALYALCLLGLGDQHDWRLAAGGSSADLWMDSCERALRAGGQIERTTQFEDLEFVVSAREDLATPFSSAQVIDVPGEALKHLQQGASSPVRAEMVAVLRQHLADADGFLIMADPAKLSPFPKTDEVRAYERLVQELARPARELTSDELPRDLARRSPSTRPIAWLYTKADRFNRGEDPEAFAAGRTNLDPAGSLRDLSLGGVQGRIDDHLPHLRMFSVSAFGRAERHEAGGWVPVGRRLQPWGLGEAFDWLLHAVADQVQAETRVRRRRSLIRAGLATGAVLGAGLLTTDVARYAHAAYQAQSDPARGLPDLARYAQAPGLFRGWARAARQRAEVQLLAEADAALESLSAAQGAAVWDAWGAHELRFRGSLASTDAPGGSFAQALAGRLAEGERRALQAYTFSLQERWRAARETPTRWVVWEQLNDEARESLAGQAESSAREVARLLHELRSEAIAAQLRRYRDQEPLGVLEAFDGRPPAGRELQGTLLEGLLAGLRVAWSRARSEASVERVQLARQVGQRLDRVSSEWLHGPIPSRRALGDWARSAEAHALRSLSLDISARTDPLTRVELLVRAQQSLGEQAELARLEAQARQQLATEEKARWARIERGHAAARGEEAQEELLRQLGAFLERFPSSSRRSEALVLRRRYQALRVELPLAARLRLPTCDWAAHSKGEGAELVRRDGGVAAALEVLPAGADPGAHALRRLGTAPPRAKGRPSSAWQDAEGLPRWQLWLPRAGHVLVLWVRVERREPALIAEARALVRSLRAAPQLRLCVGSLELSRPLSERLYLEFATGAAQAATPWRRAQGGHADWAGHELALDDLTSEPVLRLMRPRATADDEVVAVWRPTELGGLRRGPLELRAPGVRRLQVEVR